MRLTRATCSRTSRRRCKIDFPVDEWFYGAARVRQPLALLGVGAHAGICLRSDAAAAHSDPASVRCRRTVAARWSFPDTYVIDSDRLLYTCLYSQAFNPAARQCGVLVDEWTEVIPATTRDTGITFNYARPDNEPPQSMLLVTSASNTGIVAVGRSGRCIERDARSGQEARRRAGLPRSDGLLSLPAGHRDRQHLLRHHHRHRAHRRQRRR